MTKKTIIIFSISIVVLTIVAMYKMYKQYRLEQWQACQGWLLKEENLSVNLKPGDQCFDAQQDLRDFVNDY